jgi:mono/diheme cytochrome c family protein
MKIFYLGIVGVLFSCQGNPNPSRTSHGKATYEKYCVSCHGKDGKGNYGAVPNLRLSTRSLEERLRIIREGKNNMPAYSTMLADSTLRALAQYTLELSSNEQ